MTVTPPGVQSPARSFTAISKAVATVNANDDAPLGQLYVGQSGRIIVDVNIVTATTFTGLFVYTPA